MRKIIHVDMDAFYVSVEIRDEPSLAGKPVAVGGKSDRRGVLSTCNYIARQYGVSSAMATALALKKCPDLIVVPGRMHVYKEVSQIIRSIFERYTDIIEPLSLDEAYLDVTNSDLHHGSATLIAQEIREEIYQATGLTASAGIAPLKFIAKVASDLNKPNGQCTIGPNDVYRFIEKLSLKKIPGVGKVTSEKLQKLGFETCGDIRASDEAFLVSKFGKYGQVLWHRSHGIDEREVQVSRIRKSVGVERTFEYDMSISHEMADVLKQELIPELKRRAAKYLANRKVNKIGVKVKFQDFQQTTKEQACTEINIDLFLKLLSEAVSRGKGKSVRLLGVHIGLADEKVNELQLGLDL
ncbi:DNA polymerase IV [Colwellia sp. M166]|uniref:DNA polymerase IV n=1 Tax=Colwellia sp. M166 TaxID=2583805 RepID=UPI00211F30E0|nr:DNA polymerase IV [Colwellia sp. M166]UUO22693.1 DNA polymerase IV [Colwellia sp. M166]|tara:strand:- start:6037 stop:7095 length:1059 start_codon:yes stop_codon:yes gene_type:complete